MTVAPPPVAAYALLALPDRGATPMAETDAAQSDTALPLFRQLARNNSLANHRLHGACARLSEAEYRAERPCFFRTIHATLNHILFVDQRYLERLEGGSPAPVEGDIELFAEREALAAAQAESDRRLLGFVEGLGAADLARPIRYVCWSHDWTENPISAVLLHLFLHQTHHRGQVHDLLSQTTVAPPQLDEFLLAEDVALRADEMAALGLRA